MLKIPEKLLIRDLLDGFVAADWVAELDFTTLEKYPTEFVDDRLRHRRSDVIWRVRWGPDWLYVYVLLEFQSGIHPFMAARLSTYLDLLYQAFPELNNLEEVRDMLTERMVDSGPNNGSRKASTRPASGTAAVTTAYPPPV